MDTSIVSRIASLRRMSVAELRQTWRELYGEEARSKHRDFLWRRLAYRVQELQHGGLSERAKQRLEELAPADLGRATSANTAAREADSAPPSQRAKPLRDPRLPAPGTVISKVYKGLELRVTVRDDGYEYDGAMFGSLTAVAKHVTGSKSINGKLFFRLTERKR